MKPGVTRPATAPWREKKRLRLAVAPALVAACLALPARAATESVELVYGAPEAPHAVRLSADRVDELAAAPASTPLGSLWKLFVYAYLIDSRVPATAYRCTGRNPAEESYCCAPGEQIERHAALAKSCGLYFAPQRLGITPADWGRYWRQQGAPDWLHKLENLQPASEVSVTALLAGLASIDGATRMQTWRALQKGSLETRARPLLAHLGATLRVKTWSWHDAQGRRIGGFAGWLADGRPVWLRGSGTSAPIVERAAPWLARHLQSGSPPDAACVRVRFFTRYPLASVRLDGQAASDGSLAGRVDLLFANGQHLAFLGSRDLRLQTRQGRPQIDGRFGLNDYLARVLQREGAAEPAAAARALAVAARTYLVSHASFGGGCYEIDDDSRHQRVSPAAPSPSARAAAEWSDGLLLNGVSGRYHLSHEAPQQLAWNSAVRWAEAGARWDEILQRAYGGGGFSLLGESDGGECQPLLLAERWLAAQQPIWKRRLVSQPGFEVPTPLPRVCRLAHGNPYADLDRGRIYATGIGSANERLTVAHEFLHFALASHPLGRDEDFVERTARQLLALP